MMAKKYGVSFWDDENTLQLILVTDAQFCKYAYTKSHQIVYLKWINCSIHEVYLNAAVLIFFLKFSIIPDQPRHQCYVSVPSLYIFCHEAKEK